MRARRERRERSACRRGGRQTFCLASALSRAPIDPRERRRAGAGRRTVACAAERKVEDAKPNPGLSSFETTKSGPEPSEEMLLGALSSVGNQDERAGRAKSDGGSPSTTKLVFAGMIADRSAATTAAVPSVRR